MSRITIASIAALLAVLFLQGLAYAVVEVSGDARVRGVSISGHDYDGSTDDATRFYDQRVRLVLKGENDDHAGVIARVTVTEGIWDGGRNTRSYLHTTTDTVGGADVINGIEGNSAFELQEDDYAYLYAPITVGWTVSAGLMPSDWGLKLWEWGESRERLKLTGISSEKTVFGLYTEKMHESFIAGGRELDDANAYGALLIATFGEFRIGGVHVWARDKRVRISDAASYCEKIDPYYVWDKATGACYDYTGRKIFDTEYLGADAAGQRTDVFFTGQVGPVALVGEFAQETGGLFESLLDDSPTGAFLAAAIEGWVNVSAAAAVTRDGFVATPYFTPTLFFGKSQATALMDLGEELPGMNSTGGTANTRAYVLGVAKRLGDSFKIGARFMHAEFSAYDSGNDATADEYDLEFNYSFGENTTYTAAFGRLSPDVEGSEPESVTMMMHQISMGF